MKCYPASVEIDYFTGSFDEWFKSHHEQACKTALASFCDTKWLCEFTILKRGKELRCVNLKSGHVKGHQNSKGKIIDTGPYQSNFSPGRFASTWTAKIKQELGDLEKRFHEKRTRSLALKNDEVDDAFDIHRSQVEEFYSRVLGGINLTNATCLSCLMHAPEYPLKCGHALCADCARSYDTAREDGVLRIEGCPFHARGCKERKETSWIKTKPMLAGVRILTLDG